jgi:hypothetical protein
MILWMQDDSLVPVTVMGSKDIIDILEILHVATEYSKLFEFIRIQ